MPDLLKYCLSDKLCPTGVRESTKCLQGLLTKNIYLIAMFNLQLLQTALLPHPSTSKIQIATLGKNGLSVNSQNLDKKPQLQMKLEKYGHNKGRGLEATLKLVPSQVWMVLLKVKLRLLRGRCEMVEGQKWDLL